MLIEHICVQDLIHAVEVEHDGEGDSSGECFATLVSRFPLNESVVGPRLHSDVYPCRAVYAHQRGLYRQAERKLLAGCATA